MGDHEIDRRRGRDTAHEERGGEAATMRLPRPRPTRTRDVDDDVEGVDGAHLAFAQAVHAGVEDPHGGSHGAQLLERTIAGLPEHDTHVQLQVLRALLAAGHPEIRVIHVPVAGIGHSVEMFAGELPAALAAAVRRSAELQAETDPSFEGLTAMPPSQRAELTTFARRYVFGPPTTSSEVVLADAEALSRLLANLPATLDPLSQASLRQLTDRLRQAAFAVQQQLRQTIDVDDGRGESVEDHDARIAGYLQAGDEIRTGVFAGLLFSIQYARSRDFDRATQAAHAGAIIDTALGTAASMVEGRAAGATPADRGPDGRLPRGPAIVGLDGGEMPAMPQPVHPERPVDRGPAGRIRGAESRARSAQHARRLGPGRR